MTVFFYTWGFCDIKNIMHDFGGNMWYVDKHPKPIHLFNHVLKNNHKKPLIVYLLWYAIRMKADVFLLR